ncbi:MAG: S8 family peptidase [Deltaproteobacteria bacterium]
MFSDIKWIRENISKLDKPLRKELLNCYRNTRVMPCFFRDMLNSLRYSLKTVNVIVRLTEDCCPNNKRLAVSMMNEKKSEKSIKLEGMYCYPARLSPKKIAQLLKYEEIKTIHLDREVRAFLDNASAAVNASYSWKDKKTGEGITTAVIDTGIYPHADLTTPKNRITAFKDFVNNKTSPYDDNGHGTHVAGDICGNGYSSKGLYKAPAYESSIVGVKVLNKEGSGKLSDVLAGIQWCIDNRAKYNIRILNLSLGSKASGSYKDDLLCEALEKAWDSGIVVCAAAGNEGPESGTISSPGIDPKIITVGASDDRNTTSRNDDRLASFSSRGPTIDGFDKPDVVCPGTNIVSLRVAKSYNDKQQKLYRITDSYTSMSGTSMATPVCCSVIALILQANPSLSPDEVKRILTNNCWSLGFTRNEQGYGCPDLEKALQYKN